MEKITRTGVAFDPILLKKFDKIIKEKGYKNRSDAIRDIIRTFVTKKKGEEFIGTIKILYNSKKNKQISSIENDYPCLVLSSMQVHIDHQTSLSTLVVRGKKDRIHRLVEKIKLQKGVKSCEFSKV